MRTKGLEGLRAILHNSLNAAANTLATEMTAELISAMYDYPWYFKFIKEDGARQGYPYGEGELLNSMSVTPVQQSSNKLEFSFQWSAPHADVVHNGRSAYRVPSEVGEEGEEKSYTARPWTLLVTPLDQREQTYSQIQHSEVDPTSVPDLGWELAYSKFHQSFLQNLRSQGLTVSQ